MRYTGGAKLILCGEFSVLLGYPSLVARLPQQLVLAPSSNEAAALQGADPEGYTSCRLSDTVQPGFFDHLRSITLRYLTEHFKSHGVVSQENYANSDPLSKSRTGDKLSSYVEAVLSDVQRLFCMSSIPQGAGFGSSAALSVALARYVRAGLARLALPPSALFQQGAGQGVDPLAQGYEHYFHGKSSGLDTTISAEDAGSILVVYPKISRTSDNQNDSATHRTKIRRMELLHIPIVYCSVFRNEATKVRIRRIMAEKTTVLHELGRTIDRYVAQSAGNRDLPALIAELHALQTQSKLFSSSEQSFVDSIVEDTQAVGKMSGAGGACFFMAKDLEHQAEIAARCSAGIDRYAVIKPGFVGMTMV